MYIKTAVTFFYSSTLFESILYFPTVPQQAILFFRWIFMQSLKALFEAIAVDCGVDRGKGVEECDVLSAAASSGLLLWQHEFFMVVERDPHRDALRPYLYQALEFRQGILMPPEELVGSRKKQLEEVWVCGKCHLKYQNVKIKRSPDWSQWYVSSAFFFFCVDVLG
jgi:hypothetical protein